MPLFYIISHLFGLSIRFPTILAIETEPPAKFQDLVRDFYPFYGRRVEPIFELPNQVSQTVQLPLPLFNSPNMQTIHDFTSVDRKWTITLASNFIAFTAREYKRWEDFEDKFKPSFDAFNTFYKPAFFERTGLRYVNAIDRGKFGISLDTPWSQLLQPYIAGMLAQEEIGQSVTEQSITEIVKLDYFDGQVTSQHGLVQNRRTRELVYLIDNDFFTESQIGVENVFEVLRTFRTLAGSLFNWCITDELRTRLGRSSDSD